MTSDELWVCHLGTVPYLDAVTLQERVRAQRQADELPDTLLLLEHPPVYTRGRRSGAGELTLGEDFYRARGIDVVDTDRGGRITYHGPGQLVGYPIMRIADIGAYLRTMEAAIAAALADEDIAARSRCAEGPDYTGVWVEDRKIASIGVHVSRGVTTHGFAVNVNNDLKPFSWVVACGLPDVAMTSIADELRVSDPRHANYDSAALGSVEEYLGARGGRSAAPDATRDARRATSTPALACDVWHHGPTTSNPNLFSYEPLDVDEAPGVACFRKRMAHEFSEAHGRRQRLVSPRRLGIDAPLARPSSRCVAVPA